MFYTVAFKDEIWIKEYGSHQYSSKLYLYTYTSLSLYLYFLTFIFILCTWVFGPEARLCTTCMRYPRMPDPLEWQGLVSCLKWVLWINAGPLEKPQALVTAEPSSSWDNFVFLVWLKSWLMLQTLRLIPRAPINSKLSPVRHSRAVCVHAAGWSRTTWRWLSALSFLAIPGIIYPLFCCSGN